MHATRNFLSWLLAFLLAALIVQLLAHPLSTPEAGGPLLWDLPGENTYFATLAAATGMALFEPAGRLVAALLLGVAALALLLPALRRFGAVLAALVFAAGVASQASGAVPRDLPLAEGSDGGVLYLLSILCAAIAVLILFVHPRRRR